MNVNRECPLSNARAVWDKPEQFIMILPRPVDVMIPCCKDRLQFALAVLDSKQALLGALLAEREKEGELATTSLEFEYLH